MEAFDRKWGWVANVDAVSGTCRCSWEEVWNMSATEFLNILCYRRDRAERERLEAERRRGAR